MSESHTLAINEVVEYVKEANYAAAFNLLMEKLELSPEKNLALELLTFVLNQHTDQLQSEEKFPELFECYEKLLRQLPKDCELLTEVKYELGSRLYKLGRYVESFNCFKQVLQLDGKQLKAFHSLQYVKDKLVERWHFRMLNDCLRNVVYENAIWTHVMKGLDTVLDIGTGTGLLSIYAHRINAASITACEVSEPMVAIAKKVFEANGMHDVDLITRDSKELTDKDLRYGRPKLIVTEILDCGVFGEGILETLIHAKENLLAEGGQIIPHEVILTIAPFQSSSVAQGSVLLNESFEEYIFLNGCTLVAPQIDHYDAINVSQLPTFEMLSDPVDCLKVNFNNLQEMRDLFDGASNTVKLKCNQSGYVDGFVLWFRLPNDGSAAAILDTNPNEETCFFQAVFRLNQRMYVEAGRMLNVTVSCGGGRLRLRHGHNQPMEKCLEIPEDVLRFINDGDYLTRLEYDVNSLRKDGSFATVMDFCPFPYVGIMLLKEKRAKKLFCSDQARAFVEFVAENNCIDAACIEFLSTPVDSAVTEGKILFDLIILFPIQRGDVNNGHVVLYPLLRGMLKPRGVIVPEKIEVICDVIKSEYLAKSSMVINPQMDAFGITPHINQYATQHFLDLNNCHFDHDKIGTVKLADLALDDALHESFLTLRVEHKQQVDGILYYFNIFFTRKADPHITPKNCCFISRGECDSKSQLTIHFVQKFGLLKIDFVEFE